MTPWTFGPSAASWPRCWRTARRRLPTNLVEVGEGVVALASLGIVASRRDWNPVAQVFFGAFVASALVYLAFALSVTFFSGLSVPATLASAVLFVLELVALCLAG